MDQAPMIRRAAVVLIAALSTAPALAQPLRQFITGADLMAFGQTYRAAYIAAYLDGLVFGKSGPDAAFYDACILDNKLTPANMNVRIEAKIASSAELPRRPAQVALSQIMFEICGTDPSFDRLAKGVGKK
jgi:hypothetical protein